MRWVSVMRSLYFRFFFLLLLLYNIRYQIYLFLLPLVSFSVHTLTPADHF
jgi:hypothetical protein